MSTISEKEASKTAPGGTLVGKNNEITDNASGGFAVGRSHKENGIKAINKATGQHIEFEGGEVIITKPAVEDNELREFEGEMLTNRQILSKINESGGGVSFAEKGLELPTELYCSGKTYKYGGETLTDYEITQKISKCGCNHDEEETFADGGELQTLDNLSIQRKVDDVEFQLIKLVIPIFEKLKVYDIINLSEKIASYDKKQRDSSTTAEAIQYLTQDFSTFNKSNPIYSKENIERLEAFEIIPKLQPELEFKINDENQFVDTNKMVENTNGNQQRKPKYKVDNYVTYKTGDIETETWVGIVKEVKDFGNEYAYRLDAYTTDVDPPMFDSEKTNETYEASLRPSTSVAFNKAKATYEWYQDSVKNRKNIENNNFNSKEVLKLEKSLEKLKERYRIQSDKETESFGERMRAGANVFKMKSSSKSDELKNKIQEVEDEISKMKSKKEYDLNSSWSGGAVVVYDRNQSEYGDYKTIAHVFSTGEIKYFEDNLPKEVIEYIEKVKHPSNEKEVMPTNYQLSDYKNPYEVNRAIEALINSKEKDFTPNEIEFISNYSGYGGLEKQGSFSDEELKGLLYEYFTPDAVVKKMWALAYKYGFGTFTNPHILEPSVGTGNFFKYAPQDAELFGNEINNYSKRVCEILYPKAMITLQPFEKNFISKNNSIKGKLNDVHKYHLVIGNPPYGRAVSKYLAMGESDYTKATSFTEYFITRGLDLLHPGGLLIFVVGAEQYNGGTLFLDSGISVVKKNIFDKAQLVDAYRLPTKIFERTGVASEILVFKKK